MNQVTIMAHGRAQETFDRHTPLWQHHEWNEVVTFPTDDPVKTMLPKLPIGRKSHHGYPALQRFQRILEAIDQGPEWHLLCEYDSFSIRPDLSAFTAEPAMWGIVFDNGDPKFKGSIFIHPPLLIHNLFLHRLINASYGVSLRGEWGYWDRWLGVVCDEADIVPRRLPAYSQNTIQPYHLAEAIAALEKGAQFFHGVKTEDVLETLLACA